MEHSTIFEKAKKYYEQGFWTKKMLEALVKKGRLFDWEYAEITGEEC